MAAVAWWLIVVFGVVAAWAVWVTVRDVWRTRRSHSVVRQAEGFLRDE